MEATQSKSKRIEKQTKNNQALLKMDESHTKQIEAKPKTISGFYIWRKAKQSE